LWDIFREPGLLHWVLRFVRQAFNGRDVLVSNIAHLNAAITDSLTIHMNGARAALRDAATEFRTSHPEFVRG
jgi:hypothetical protein